MYIYALFVWVSQVHPTGFVNLKDRDAQMKTLSAEVIGPVACNGLFVHDRWSGDITVVPIFKWNPSP